MELPRLLAVSPLTGEIRWKWIERMRKEQLVPVLENWALEAMVRYWAPSHRAKKILDELPTSRLFLPSYSPELNPAERVFEEVRRRVEGKVYDTTWRPNDEGSKATLGSCGPTPGGSGACAVRGGLGKRSNRCRRTPRTLDAHPYHSDSVY